MKERLTEIEIRMAHQEDLLDALNQTVYRQQRQLEQLEQLCTALAGRLQELRLNLPNQSVDHEKPPHY